MTAEHWPHTLRERALKIRAQLDALDDEIVLAHAAGLSWRDIGTAAGINHEKARQAAGRVAKRPDRKPLPPLSGAG
jgi:predicted HAD superfamily Cof-like phosphohydrolase